MRMKYRNGWENFNGWAVLKDTKESAIIGGLEFRPNTHYRYVDNVFYIEELETEFTTLTVYNGYSRVILTERDANMLHFEPNSRRDVLSFRVVDG